MATLLSPMTGGTIPSTMSDQPLAIRAILEHALRNHARKEIVSRDGAGIVRMRYADFGRRVAKLANALRTLGIGPGDRVASFAWNGHRHLELYYAVPMIGAVLHTVNIRLFPDQVAFVLEHAGDRAVFFDGSLVKALKAAAALQPGAQRSFVMMGGGPEPFDGAFDYETLLAAEPDQYPWPEIDERSAALLCYTSATTGDPKGVLFSHRSTYLHALAIGLADALAITERDRMLPIVPMFHVNAWGTPFASLMVGADFILPMERLDPAGVIELCESERVTCSAGVPTVWMAVRDMLRAQGKRLPTLRRIVIGGAAMPRSLRDDLEELGINAVHAWGMTEMSPIGTVNVDISQLDDDPELQRRERYKQGRFSPIVSWRVVDEHGNDVPADGVSRGELLVRGYAVAKEYFNNAAATAAAFEPDGWFHTGDVCTVDEHGYMEIVDRVKDFIKSGGEWISSVEVENVLMGHPGLKEACVFGVPHATWIERPVAVAVVREGHAPDEGAILAWLSGKLAKWQIPDRVVFVEAIPRTGVGKFLKRDLRERYRTLLEDR
ncbi:MAG TPA: long-chain fatty acid--CoA ligase [Candidatus Acidoferrum sp.]|jgi:fatty-acyl-CoA synthase|nr:long-chain fatty acid--CoA ligase [Candidatus Acidoferrum sp.]